MKFKLALLPLLSVLPVYAGTMGGEVKNNPWYAAIGTGYSWTMLPGINNPNPTEWDDSVQGYNSTLGDRGFYTFEAGKQVHSFIDASLMYINHEPFNYQMYQSGVSDTEGFTGNMRNRYFNLGNRALLVSGFLHPAEAYYTLGDVGMKPYIGIGIGYASNLVNNFYTVGSQLVDTVNVGSTSSIGNPVYTNSFAWQGTGGVNFAANQHVSIDVGYRYYDGGKFNTSSEVFAESVGLTAASPWSGRLQANQLFVDFRYTV